MTTEVFQDCELEMKEGVAFFQSELLKVRTGRASVALLDGVMVDYYGTPTPLKQLANLAVADSTLLTAQPYDVTQIDAIERAIQLSDLGLNPGNDGKLIRIPVPMLTEERRQGLVKIAHEISEKAKNRIRQIRRESNEKVKGLEKDKEISEDDAHRGLDRVQKLHDHYVEQINSTLKAKEEAILQL